MNPTIRHTIAFVLYLFFQVFFFNEFTIGQVAIPFVFLLYLLMMPMQLSTPVLYLVAFGMGLLVDILSINFKTGLNASACLLMVAARPFWIRFIIGSNYRSLEEVNMREQNLFTYALYLFPLILLHHTAYFLLDAWPYITRHFPMMLARIASSGVYTFILCLLLGVLIYKRG